MEYKQIAILNNTPRSLPQSRLPGRIMPLTGSLLTPVVSTLPLTNRLWTLIGTRCLTNGAQWSGIGLFYLALNSEAAKGSEMLINPQLHNWYNELYVNINLSNRSGSRSGSVPGFGSPGSVPGRSGSQSGSVPGRRLERLGSVLGREAPSEGASAGRAAKQSRRTVKTPEDMRYGTVRPLTGIEAQVLQLLLRTDSGETANAPSTAHVAATVPANATTGDASTLPVPQDTLPATRKKKASKGKTGEKIGTARTEGESEHTDKLAQKQRFGTILPVSTPSGLRSILPRNVFSDITAEPAQLYHPDAGITGDWRAGQVQHREHTARGSEPTPTVTPTAGSELTPQTADRKTGKGKASKVENQDSIIYIEQPVSAEQTGGERRGTIRPATESRDLTAQQEDIFHIETGDSGTDPNSRLGTDPGKEGSITERLINAERKAKTTKDAAVTGSRAADKDGKLSENAKPTGTIRPITAESHDIKAQQDELIHIEGGDSGTDPGRPGSRLGTDPDTTAAPAASRLRTDPNPAKSIGSTEANSSVADKSSITGFEPFTDKSELTRNAELTHLIPAAGDKSQSNGTGIQSTIAPAKNRPRFSTRNRPQSKSKNRPQPQPQQQTGSIKSGIKPLAELQTVTNPAITPLSLIHPGLRTDPNQTPGLRTDPNQTAGLRTAPGSRPGTDPDPNQKGHIAPASESLIYNHPALKTPAATARAAAITPGAGVQQPGEALHYQEPGAVRERVIVHNRKVPHYISKQRMLSVPALGTRRDGSSLFYKDAETNYQTSRTSEPANNANIERAVQKALADAKPVQHKPETSVKKVDMTVNKPQQQQTAAGDPLSDPVQLNKLVSKVYEQLERKITHERRRVGL